MLADLVELGLAYARHADDVLVSHDDRIGAIDDGAHRELRLWRITDLPDENEVERRLERRGHFSRDRNAAARERQHDDRVPIVLDKGSREPASGFGPVRERHACTPWLEGPDRAVDDNAFQGRNNPRR